MTEILFKPIPIIDRDKKYFNVFYIAKDSMGGKIGINKLTTVADLENTVKGTYDKATYMKLLYLIKTGIIKINMLRPYAPNGATAHNHIGSDLNSLNMLDNINVLYSNNYSGVSYGVFEPHDSNCIDRIKSVSGVGSFLANSYGKTYPQDTNNFQMKIVGSKKVKNYTAITGISYISSDSVMIIIYQNSRIIDVQILSEGSDYIGTDVSFIWSNILPDYTTIDLMVDLDYGNDGLYNNYNITVKDYKTNSDSYVVAVDNDNNFIDNIHSIVNNDFHMQYLYFLDERLYDDEADLTILNNLLPKHKNITLIPSYNEHVDEDSITRYEIPYVFNYIKELALVHFDNYKVFANSLILPDVSFPASQKFSSADLEQNKIMPVINGVVYKDLTLYPINNALSSTTVNVLYNYIKHEYYKLAKKWLGKKLEIFEDIIDDELNRLTTKLNKIGIVEQISYDFEITNYDTLEININFKVYKWFNDILITVLYKA